MLKKKKNQTNLVCFIHAIHGQCKNYNLNFLHVYGV